MPDVQIHPIGVVSAPGDYKVPDTAELLLKNAYAKFDGSGAAGPYLPLLRIISDAGTTLVEAVSDTTIAAGASADASWFPRVGAASAGSSAGAVSWADLFDITITVAPGAVYTQYDFTTASFYTNDSTTFTVDATNGLKLNSNGDYQFAYVIEWTAAGATTAGYAEAQWNIPNVASRFSREIYVPSGGGTFYATTCMAWGAPMKASTVGSHGKLFLRQFSDVTATCKLSFSASLISTSHGNF